MSDRPEEKSKVMTVAQACRILNTTPQVVNKYIRDGKLPTYNKEGVRQVDVDELQQLLEGRSSAGRPAGSGAETKANQITTKYGVGEGSILYCVIETKRRVYTVDKLHQEVVTLKSAHDISNWSGTKHTPSKLHEDLEKGLFTAAEDNLAVLAALIRSWSLNGDDDMATILADAFNHYIKRGNDDAAGDELSGEPFATDEVETAGIL